MQSVRQASLHPIDMFLIPLRFDDNTGAAKIIEVCERQEKSSEVQERREEKLREVEGLDVRGISLAEFEDGLVQNSGDCIGPMPNKLDFREVRDDAEERAGREVAEFHSYGTNEGLEVWVVPEEVAKVKDSVPALEVNIIGDQKTESARTEVVACEGEVAEGLEIITRMANDSLDDFPGQ